MCTHSAASARLNGELKKLISHCSARKLLYIQLEMELGEFDTHTTNDESRRHRRDPHLQITEISSRILDDQKSPHASDLCNLTSHMFSPMALAHPMRALDNRPGADHSSKPNLPGASQESLPGGTPEVPLRYTKAL